MVFYDIIMQSGDSAFQINAQRALYILTNMRRNNNLLISILCKQMKLYLYAYCSKWVCVCVREREREREREIKGKR